MKPTRKRLLLVIALVGGVCAVSVSRLTLSLSGVLLPVRGATPLATAVMAIALLWWTLLVRRRLTHVARARHEARMRSAGTTNAPFVMQERPLHPLVAARTVALAFAASRAGAYVVGWYLGICISYIGHLGSDDVRLRFAYAAITSLLSLALVAVALWLERSCKLPPPPPGAEASPA